MGGIDIERLREIDRNQVFLARNSGLLRLRIGEVFAKLAEGRKYTELGFNSVAAYASERLSRSGRWLSESRTVAVRLVELPRIRRAFERGMFGWAVLELLCRHATAETEMRLLWLARKRTVRELRGLLPEKPTEEDDAEQQRGSIHRRMPADHAWTLEATLRLAAHVAGGCAEDEALEWVLAEAYTTLICDMPPEISDISEPLARHAEEIRKRMRALATEREALEAELEGELPRDVIPGDRLFDAGAPIPDDPNALDRMLRELCATLDAADLWLGKSLSELFRGRYWEQLGYASDGQYARERLGLSRSSAWERVRLARSTSRLGHVVEAVYANEIGTCAARMLVRIVTPETERAWVERAKVRTFKHLREEIELASMDVRLHGQEANRWPPDEERIRRYHEWQRWVLTGEAFESAATAGGSVRMSAGSEEGEEEDVQDSPKASPVHPGGVRAAGAGGPRIPKKARAGYVDVALRTRQDTVTFWQVLEDAFDRSGQASTFVEWLCKSYTDTWVPTLGESDKWEEIYARDLYQCTCPVC